MLLQESPQVTTTSSFQPISSESNSGILLTPTISGPKEGEKKQYDMGAVAIHHPNRFSMC